MGGPYWWVISFLISSNRFGGNPPKVKQTRANSRATLRTLHSRKIISVRRSYTVLKFEPNEFPAAIVKINVSLVYRVYWTMAWSTVTSFGLNSQGRGNAPFWYEYIACIGRCMDSSHRNRSEQSGVTVPSGTSMGNQSVECVQWERRLPTVRLVPPNTPPSPSMQSRSESRTSPKRTRCQCLLPRVLANSRPAIAVCKLSPAPGFTFCVIFLTKPPISETLIWVFLWDEFSAVLVLVLFPSCASDEPPALARISR